MADKQICKVVCKSPCAPCHKLDVFPGSLIRMASAAAQGYLELLDMALQEELIVTGQCELTDYINLDITSEVAALKVDTDVSELMSHYGGTSGADPIRTDDGSLFTALSVALCGGDKLSTMLRVFSSIELAKNKEHYLMLPNAEQLLSVAPSYEDACIDCTHVDNMESIWAFYAAASVIGIPIVSIYPPVNSVMDEAFQILNTTVNPRVRMHPNACVYILWCKHDCSSPPKELWVPDHFVPLIRVTVDQKPIRSLSEDTYLMNRKEECVHLELATTDAITEGDLIMEIDDSENLPQVTEVQQPPESVIKPAPPLLKEKVTFMGMTALLDVLVHEQPTSPAIPEGKKENLYFVLDNSENIQRRGEGKKSRFTDDCGVWDSRSASTKMEYYIWQTDNMKTIACIKRDNLFGRKDKKIFLPFAVQPDESELIVVKKATSHLKRDMRYRRRVTWFERVPEGLNSTLNKAVVEYTGTYPSEECYHGNMKNYTHTYRRLPEKLRKELLEIVPFISLEESYKVISEKMGLPVDAQIMKIAFNLKYNKSAKRQTTKRRQCVGNVSTSANSNVVMGEANTMTQIVDDTRGLADSDHTTIYIYGDEQWDEINEVLIAKKAVNMEMRCVLP